MAMHGEHMEAQPPMGLKGSSGDGGVRSYQAPSQVQGVAGNACDGRIKCVQGLHGEGKEVGQGGGRDGRVRWATEFGERAVASTGPADNNR